MPRSEALKRAQKAYMIRIKGTEIGDRIKASMLESSRRAFNRRYANDEEFRRNKNAYERNKAYYRAAENDGVLKSLKLLFGGIGR
jgi:hypothetical protein